MGRTLLWNMQIIIFDMSTLQLTSPDAAKPHATTHDKARSQRTRLNLLFNCCCYIEDTAGSIFIRRRLSFCDPESHLRILQVYTRVAPIHYSAIGQSPMCIVCLCRTSCKNPCQQISRILQAPYHVSEISVVCRQCYAGEKLSHRDQQGRFDRGGVFRISK